jgi:hypothetical protein
LNVVSVNDAEKSILVMYGGAYSGTYSVKIRHSTYGLVDGDVLTMTVGSHVESYSPNVGSVYGGTLLTIKGTNWDPEIITNNPVSVVFNGALGAMPCYVLTTAVDQITCRLKQLSEAEKKENNKVGKVVVFLKTSEEAACENPKCDFTFTETVPEVSSVEKEWDAQNNVWTIKVSGTGFTGT